jgi:hypothetical protein
MKEPLLIVTYDMIPFSPTFGGCQRIYFLADFLADKGYEVHIIHVRGKQYGNFGNKIKFTSIPISFKDKYINKMFLPELYRKNHIKNVRKIELRNSLKLIIKKNC